MTGQYLNLYRRIHALTENGPWVVAAVQCEDGTIGGHLFIDRTPLPGIDPELIDPGELAVRAAVKAHNVAHAAGLNPVSR